MIYKNSSTLQSILKYHIQDWRNKLKRGVGRGTLGETQYRNTVRRKNWQILKYRVENQRNTDTTFMIGHAYFNLYSSRRFVYLKHVCTSNQPQQLRAQATQAHYMDANVTVACERCCVTNGHLQRLVWEKMLCF